MLNASIALFITIGSVGTLPTSKDWSADHASHLLLRAGFGGTPEQIAYLVKLGRAKSVDYLLDFERVPDDLKPPALEQNPPPNRMRNPGTSDDEMKRMQAMRRRSDAAQLSEVLTWWIQTMVSSPRPMQEKLVLFWHGHFTSGYREVRSSNAMYEQNQLFRKHAAGNFRDMLIAITTDPAMVLYLNTQQNRKGKPNENYARELMELFTLGAGHYTEKDIKEAARAFTGINVNPASGDSDYRLRQHDSGPKTFMGRTGNWGPGDIIDIILAQPAAAEHIVRRFWTFFAYEEPPPLIIKSLATTLRNNKYNLKPMLREMLMCDAFYSDRARFTHIKSPVELVVGTLRVLEIPPVDAVAMNFAMRRMGQQLLQPPNVKGWDGGADWITASTLFNRYNLVGTFIDGTDNPQSRRVREAQRKRLEESLGAEAPFMSGGAADTLQPAFDPAAIIQQFHLDTREKAVDHFVQRMLQRSIDPARKQILIDALKEQFPNSEKGDAAQVRFLLHLITSMPEYQLS
jgi:uncharacterized protein (DUF1800 family)